MIHIKWRVKSATYIFLGEHNGPRCPVQSLPRGLDMEGKRGVLVWGGKIGGKNKSCVSTAYNSELNCWAMAHSCGSQETEAALLDGNVWWLRAPTSIILPWGIFLLPVNSPDEPQRGNLEEPNRWLSSLQWPLLGGCYAENSMARVYQAGMYWSAAKIRNITSCGQISPALHLADVP